VKDELKLLSDFAKEENPIKKEEKEDFMAKLSKKALIIGWDSAQPSRLEKHVKDGRLPNVIFLRIGPGSFRRLSDDLTLFRNPASPRS
jgi:hypothetical protein